jgi:hypothetical protein
MLRMLRMGVLSVMVSKALGINDVADVADKRALYEEGEGGTW